MEGNYAQTTEAGAFGGMIVMLLVAGIFFYMAFAQFKIAQKLNHQNAWFAFIPILNTVQLIQMAGKPMSWFFGLLVPILNLILFIKLWITVSKATGNSAMVGVMTLIPPFCFVTIGMMAFGSGSVQLPPSAPMPPSQPSPREPQSVA